MRPNFAIDLALGLLLAGCGPAPAPTQYPTITPSATLSFNQDEWLTTVYAGRTATAAVPTVPATPSVTPTPEHFDFPSWVANPGNPVFVAIMSDEATGERFVGFINLSTGEVFRSTIYPTPRIFWIDSHQIGVRLSFRMQNVETLSVIDVTTGSSVRYWDVASIEKYLDGLPTTPRFRIRFDEYASESPIIVRDSQAGEEFQLTPGDDGIYDREAAMSTMGRLVAVTQTGDIHRATDRLTTYDLTDRQAIASVGGSFRNIKWSPDERWILYERELGDEAAGYKTVPCLLEPTTLESTCLYLIPESRAGYSTSFYGWSPEGNKVSFIFWGLAATGDHEQAGGVCVFALATAETTCPTSAIQALNGEAITDYDWSPDGRYFAVIHSPYGMPGSDDVTGSQLAIFSYDGQKYFDVGISYPGEIDVHGWRPGPDGGSTLPQHISMTP